MSTWNYELIKLVWPSGVNDENEWVKQIQYFEEGVWLVGKPKKMLKFW